MAEGEPVADDPVDPTLTIAKQIAASLGKGLHPPADGTKLIKPAHILRDG